MKKIILSCTILLFTTSLKAQVGIGTVTPNQSAQLEIVSSNKGVLFPQVSLTSSTDNTSITNGNVNSLFVYNTATASDVVPGYYYWTGTKWTRLTNIDDIAAIVAANEVDGTIGNEVTNATLNGGLNRSGTGTTASPYTLGLAPGNAVGDVLTWNGTSWVSQIPASTSAVYESQVEISSSSAWSITTTNFVQIVPTFSSQYLSKGVYLVNLYRCPNQLIMSNAEGAYWTLISSDGGSGSGFQYEGSGNVSECGDAATFVFKVTNPGTFTLGVVQNNTSTTFSAFAGNGASIWVMINSLSH